MLTLRRLNVESLPERTGTGLNWIVPVLLLLTGLQLPEAAASPLPPVAMATATMEAESHAEAASQSAYLEPDLLRELAGGFLQDQVDEWNSPETRYEVVVDRVDSRLRLLDCGESLQVSAPPQGIAPGRVAVRISCAGEQPWNIYVTGRIRALRQVVVTARPMGRGETITASDLMLLDQELDQLRRGYFTEPAEVIGKVVKRPIPGNRVVESRAIAMPRLIKRGEMVQIVAENQTVRVQMEGVALSDGALGDRIQVRNRRSGRVVSAVVNGSGQVDVPL